MFPGRDGNALFNFAFDATAGAACKGLCKLLIPNWLKLPLLEIEDG
jgi:hypothetical protein